MVFKSSQWHYFLVFVLLPLSVKLIKNKTGFPTHCLLECPDVTSFFFSMLTAVKSATAKLHTELQCSSLPLPCAHAHRHYICHYLPNAHTCMHTHPYTSAESIQHHVCDEHSLHYTVTNEIQQLSDFCSDCFSNLFYKVRNAASFVKKKTLITFCPSLGFSASMTKRATSYWCITGTIVIWAHSKFSRS